MWLAAMNSIFTVPGIAIQFVKVDKDHVLSNGLFGLFFIIAGLFMSWMILHNYISNNKK